MFLCSYTYYSLACEKHRIVGSQLWYLPATALTCPPPVAISAVTVHAAKHRILECHPIERIGDIDCHFQRWPKLSCQNLAE